LLRIGRILLGSCLPYIGFIIILKPTIGNKVTYLLHFIIICIIFFSIGQYYLN